MNWLRRLNVFRWKQFRIRNHHESFVLIIFVDGLTFAAGFAEVKQVESPKALKLEVHKVPEKVERPKPCHVGIHWIALVEYSQMSTHVPGFQSSFCVFCILFGGLN